MSVKKNEFGLDNPGFQSNGENLPDSKRSSVSKRSSETKIGIEEDEVDRIQWGNDLQFLMSCIAMSVGLGNIWRFPFTAYENGGGAFLIPYITVLLLIGRPMYYLEMGLGQFTSRGNVKMFQSLGPALKGIGYAQLLATICVGTYYCSIIATTMFYLANSFTSDLPWATCKPEWTEGEDYECVPSKSTGTPSNNSKSSSELYYLKEVLHEVENLEGGIGLPDWKLTLCLFASWICTFLISRNGVKSSGKAAYFLALFPYVIMITLLIKGVTLEGAGDGIMYFITPEWDKLLSADVWYAAVTQCFFSLNVGFGSLVMLASYNNFDHNINRDALVVTTLDTFTSLLAGTTIFAILGNLAKEMNVPVDKVITSGGAGIAFISYPEAIAKFDNVPWLFAILFFFMLFVLGIGSLVALQNCSITVIMDKFPSLKAWQVSAGTAVIGFIVGLAYVTPAGQYILNMVDFFGGTFLVLFFAIFELGFLVWHYGLQNWCIDMEFMVQKKVHIYWRIMWGFVTPVALIAILIYFLVTLEPLTYGGVPYTPQVIAFGWLIFAVGIAQFVVWIGYYTYVNRRLGFPQNFAKAFSTEDWHPKGAARLIRYKKFKQEKRAEFDKTHQTVFQVMKGALFNR